MSSELSDISALYERPLGATRSGPLFNAHAYPTKISAESVALLIACHTSPGDVVFDGFGGSCSTGLAALLCEKPSDELRAEAKARGLKPAWGPRRAIVYELSGLGSFIGQTLCSKPNALAFARAAERLLKEAERRLGWIYAARDTSGRPAIARYFIWSDHLRCPSCDTGVSLWTACVRLKPAHILDTFTCASCAHTARLDDVPRVLSPKFDDLIGLTIPEKSRTIARVDGVQGKTLWSRQPTTEDLDLVERIRSEPIPPHFPLTPMMDRGGMAWGDLWRSGYHEGITHVHHFYTRRNLLALSVLHELIENEPPEMRDPLQFWISSYNSSHSTLMTRVVAKKNHDELALTSAQPGVLYLSGLPVEKNIFLGLRRKLKTVTQAFATLQDMTGQVEVIQGSSTRTALPDASVDYVFTDPPFGGNIPYSEVNFIAEAWLGRTTNVTDEAIMSPSQHKGIDAYQELMEQAFRELRRILKPNGRATVAFHSTQAAVWKALVASYTDAGFSLETSSILDKKQGSFKQVTTANFAKGDPLILLRPLRSTPTASLVRHGDIIRHIKSQAEEHRITQPDEWTPERLYSRFVEHYLRQHTSPPINADQFYLELASVGA